MTMTNVIPISTVVSESSMNSINGVSAELIIVKLLHQIYSVKDLNMALRFDGLRLLLCKQ